MYIPDFRFMAQFEGELCEEQTQKIRKNSPKTHVLGTMKGWNEAEKLTLTKGTSRDPTKYTYLISAS